VVDALPARAEALPGPALGLIETASIARGVEALDALLKRARVDVLLTSVLPRGKYLILFGGGVAEVEEALKAGLEIAGGSVLDHFLIPSVHPQLPAAIKGRVAVAGLDAVGLIETRDVASSVYAGDAAAKAAAITLIEARQQPGGKGLVVMTGEVGAVRAAVAAGVASLRDPAGLVAEVVIPLAEPGVLRHLV
jgi:microcompartment protein CcmL/EutN